MDEEEIYSRIKNLRKRLDQFQNNNEHLKINHAPHSTINYIYYLLCIFFVVLPLNFHISEKEVPVVFFDSRKFKITTLNEYSTLIRSDIVMDAITPSAMRIAKLKGLRPAEGPKLLEKNSVHEVNGLVAFALKKQPNLTFRHKWETSSELMVSRFSDPVINSEFSKLVASVRRDDLPIRHKFDQKISDLNYELIALVSKSDQKLTLIKNGDHLYTWDVSTARLGKFTPTGTWQAKWLSKDHKSSLYNSAPMPYSVFYYGDFAIHGTMDIEKLGMPASAGCVRLAPEHARILYKIVEKIGKSNFVVRVFN